MADKKNKKAPATFGSIALQNYAAQRGYEVGQDASLGETLKPAVELLGNYAENAIAERAKFIDNLPEDYEVELLPVDSREAFTNFASDAKQGYSDAAGVAAKYSANPNSEQYREAVKRMENIKKGLSTNFDDYNKLADIRKKYTNNHGNEVALTDEQEVMYTDIIAGKNFESTPNGLVYNRKDLDGNTVEQIPINDLPTIDYMDPELGSNMVTNVLDNPYNGGVKGSDMQTTLSNANVQIQNLTSNPAKLKQAIFNGFGGEKTKFINYYVGENLIDQKNATFLDGINDINGDNLITKDDMQDGVWSFKDGEAGNAARTLFERTIKDHKNDPDFINNKKLNVRQKLNSFMSDIAKDKYLEGQANKFKNKYYNLRGIGERGHDQIQGDFDKLNNHEPISNYGKSNEFFPVEGKPGLYYTLSEDGKTRTEVTRDTLEKALDIFSVRGDFNTDPVKAAKGTPVMLDFGVSDLKNKDKVKVDETDDNTEGQDWSIETVDYENQEKKARPSSKQKNNLSNLLKNLDKKMTGKNLKDNSFEVDVNMSEQDLNNQIKLSNQYINEIEKVYLGTGLINDFGDMASFSIRGIVKPKKSYELEKKRNIKLKEQLSRLNPTEVTEDEDVVENEVNNASKGRIPIDGIDYNEVTSKDVPSTEVYNLKPITQEQFVSTEGVQSKIGEIAEKHGFSADQLIKLIKFETGGSFDPSQKSGASSAVGLIQFMPETIKGLNKELDSEKVAAMTILEQLELVDAYFDSQPQSVKGSHPYLQVATPKAANYGPDEILYEKDSEQAKANPSWQNKNGDVTPNSILIGAGFDPMPSTRA